MINTPSCRDVLSDLSQSVYSYSHLVNTNKKLTFGYFSFCMGKNVKERYYSSYSGNLTVCLTAFSIASLRTVSTFAGFSTGNVLTVLPFRSLIAILGRLLAKVAVVDAFGDRAAVLNHGRSGWDNWYLLGLGNFANGRHSGSHNVVSR